jgi:hypothetical protein
MPGASKLPIPAMECPPGRPSGNARSPISITAVSIRLRISHSIARKLILISSRPRLSRLLRLRQRLPRVHPRLPQGRSHEGVEPMSLAMLKRKNESAGTLKSPSFPAAAPIGLKIGQGMVLRTRGRSGRRSNMAGGAPRMHWSPQRRYRCTPGACDCGGS